MFIGNCNYFKRHNQVILFVFFSFLPLIINAQGYKLKQGANGLKYHIIKSGKGEAPSRGDMVNIYYTSLLMNDTVINNYDSTTGVCSFVLGEGEILKGIDQAIQLLKPGGVIYLELPPELAYGSHKIGKIPGGSVVKVKLELISYSAAFFKPLKKDTLTIANGLKKLIVKETQDALPEESNYVTFNFTGYYFNANGERKIFDKSTPGQNLTFQLGGIEMIRGLDIGLRTMRKSEKATFIISPALAYKNEKRGVLPANTTIYLDVELLNFTDPFYEPINSDTVSLPSGLKYIVIKNGNGEKPGRNDIASIRYLGYIVDSAGKRIIFDKLPDNQPFRYRIGGNNTLMGVNIGVKNMNKGAQYKLIIPPQLAFKDRHIGIIQPNSIVYYDIELKDITPMFFLGKGEQDTITYPSGLKILNINHADRGMHADSNATIYANFTGYFIDSTNTPFIFQNTLEDGKPYEFHLNRAEIIKGMKEALGYMHEGQVSKLFIPADLAYGTYGMSGVIPPNKDLIFDIEVIRIISKPN